MDGQTETQGRFIALRISGSDALQQINPLPLNHRSKKNGSHATDAFGCVCIVPVSAQIFGLLVGGSAPFFLAVRHMNC